MRQQMAALVSGLGLCASSVLAQPDGGVHTTDEVIVIDPNGEDTGTPEAGTASNRIVDADDIALTPARSGDDVLRLVPGLHISQHASEGKAQQFFLRGFDAVHGADLELKVGGAVINEASNVHGHGYVDIGFVLPEAIASLHAHKGSFDLSQGPFGTAGTVEIELGVAPQLRGHRVSYEAGTTNRHRVLALSAPIDLPEQSFFALEAMSDDGFGENRSTRRLVGLGQHRFELGGDRSLDVFATGYAARFGEPGTLPIEEVESGRFGFYDAFAPDTGGSSRRLLAGLRFADSGDDSRLKIGLNAGRRQLDLAENFTGFLVNPEMGDTRGQRHDATSAAATARLERDLDRGATRITAVTGAGARADRIDQSEDMLDQAGQPWMRSRDLEATQLAGDVLAGVRIERGGARVEIGARLDALRIAATDRTTGLEGSDAMAQVSPRLATSYTLNPGLSLFAAYGRGLRPPEARSVVPNGSDAAAGITSSDAVEIGTRARLGDRVSLGVAGFGIWTANELVFDHMTGVNLARNATRRLGAEVDVEIEATDWLSVRGDLTATDARFVDSGAEVPYAPRLMGTAEARVRLPSGVKAGAQLVAVAPRPLAHGATGDRVAVMNLLGSYRLEWFDIGMQIDNLWNARWREGEYHYASRFDPGQPASQIPKIHYAAGRPFGARVSLTTWF
jgi:outer membrane receptor protein involved in Fe transport